VADEKSATNQTCPARVPAIQDGPGDPRSHTQNGTWTPSLAAVIVIGDRRRDKPAPPRFVFEALTQPHSDPSRPWLSLLDDEQEPAIIEAKRPNLVVWGSLWPHRPTATIRFEIESDEAGGTSLRWVLEVEAPEPDASAIGHMRKRINTLINGELRYSFGQ